MATATIELNQPDPALSNEACSSKTAALKQGEGLRQHYLKHIHDLQLQVRQKTHNLNRLEAQRNDLNSKILDCALGHNDALFRRALLKDLVSIHSQEACKGDELTHDETTIISGALDLTKKIAEEAMTPIESTFSLDVNSKLDWEAMRKILARGHNRVLVYFGSPKNIIGLLLVKSLLTVRPETETPVSAVSIRRIPRVPADMPLYDILNEFQKGSSHMAAVVRTKAKNKITPSSVGEEKPDDNKFSCGDSQLTTPLEAR